MQFMSSSKAGLSPEDGLPTAEDNDIEVTLRPVEMEFVEARNNRSSAAPW